MDAYEPDVFDDVKDIPDDETTVSEGKKARLYLSYEASPTDYLCKPRPDITPEEMNRAIKAYQEGLAEMQKAGPDAPEPDGFSAAVETIEAGNLLLIMSIIPKCTGNYMDRYDLDYQMEGVLALLDCASSFDTTREAELSTFAYNYIKGAIIRWRQKNSGHTETQTEQRRSINKAIEELQEKLGRNPTSPEIADHLKITRQALDRRRNIPTTISAQTVKYVNDDNGEVTIENTLSNRSVSIEDKVVFGEADIEAFRQAREMLPVRQQAVLSVCFDEYHRFCREKDERLQKEARSEIAAQRGIPAETVLKILHKDVLTAEEQEIKAAVGAEYGRRYRESRKTENQVRDERALLQRRARKAVADRFNDTEQAAEEIVNQTIKRFTKILNKQFPHIETP